MQARSSLDFARSQAVPDPTFGLGVRRFNENDSTALVAGVSFPIPVFNRNQGGIQRSQSQHDQGRCCKAMLQVCLYGNQQFRHGKVSASSAGRNQPLSG